MIAGIRPLTQFGMSGSLLIDQRDDPPVDTRRSDRTRPALTRDSSFQKFRFLADRTRPAKSVLRRPGPHSFRNPATRP